MGSVALCRYGATLPPAPHLPSLRRGGIHPLPATHQLIVRRPIGPPPIVRHSLGASTSAGTRFSFGPKGAATASSAHRRIAPLATRRAREYSRCDVHHEGETGARSSVSRGSSANGGCRERSGGGRRRASRGAELSVRRWMATQGLLTATRRPPRARRRAPRRPRRRQRRPPRSRPGCRRRRPC